MAICGQGGHCFLGKHRPISLPRARGAMNLLNGNAICGVGVSTNYNRLQFKGTCKLIDYPYALLARLNYGWLYFMRSVYLVCVKVWEYRFKPDLTLLNFRIWYQLLHLRALERVCDDPFRLVL